jgi:hypothetical protein
VGFLNRLMTAIQIGVHAYNERALIPTDNYDWDDYQSRLFRYALAESYYNSITYRNISTFSTRLKIDNGLYKHVRNVYNPVYRLVEAYTSKVYGGALDFEDLSRGAIPVTMASDELKEAMRQLWLWSNWRLQKSLYVRHGAQLGDVFLKVVDEPEKEKVRLEVLHPGKVKDASFDAVGNVKTIELEYERTDDGKQWYKYGELWKDGSVATTKEGKPYAYPVEMGGTGVSQWDYVVDFVPFTLTKHKDMGQTWGANAFHAQLGKIDELNDSASLVNDQIRKAVNVMWYFAGVQKKTDLSATTEDKDQLSAIYGPADSQPFPMVSNIDLTSAGVNIERLLAELERDMPELAMHRLRDAGNPTAPGIKAGFNDAIDRFTEAQGVYDDGLIRATKMAVTIGGIRRYEGFEAFGMDSYDNGDLEHFIQDRPIVVDELSKLEKITALNTAQAPKWLILRELDFDADTIAEVMAEDEKNRRESMRGFAQGVFDEDEDGDVTDTEEEADTEAQADARAEPVKIAA